MNDQAGQPAARSAALTTAWRYQRQASIVADRLKASYDFWRKVLLMLAVAVAFMETLSGQLPESIGRGVAGAGAFLIALVPVIASRKAGSENLRAWVGARSVSEELKAEVFRYLTACGKYATGNPDAKLNEVATAMVDNLDASLVAGVEADDKPIPEVADVDDFIRVRVDGQIRYYTGAAAREQKVVSRNRRVQFALALVAAAIGASGALSISELTIAAWVAVVTTVGASLAFWVAAGRHDHLVISYTSTARRLESIKNGWQAAPQPDPCALVTDCEAAISSQNEGWMVEFMRAK